MGGRTRPRLVAGRTTNAEYALVIAAATAGGQTMNDFVRLAVLEAASLRLREALESGSEREGIGGWSDTRAIARAHRLADPVTED